MADLDERWQRRFDATQKRVTLKKRAVELKGGVCQICGYSRCLAALTFHHPNPREKEFSVSETLNWDRMQAEIAKCDLLCANCHAEVHAGEHPTYLDEDVKEWD